MSSEAAVVSAPAEAPAPTTPGAHRFAILDGWRATSILLVLAGHLLPLGPGRWGMNAPVAGMGMAIFFILSGFLITRFLSEGAELRSFIIRRFFRIVPLAWLAMTAILIAARAPLETWLANFFFVANLPPMHIVEAGSHLWSLCVEMQFYVGIALFVALFGRRALIVLPLFAFAVTGLRIQAHAYGTIVTWLRVDEILCGGVLALIYAGWYGEWPKRLLSRINAWWMLPLLLASAHVGAGPLDYARPYIAMLAVGSSLFAPPPLMARMFESRIAAYIATVSYAVYIIHGVARHTWLGSGDTLVRYLKRPLLFAITFALAHVSTFYFERPLNELARRRTRGMSLRLRG